MKKNIYLFSRLSSGLLLAGCMMLFTPSAKCQQTEYPFQNPSLSFDQRVNDLVSRLSLREKVKLMQNNDGGGVSRLGIPAYNWWNESLHGVARDGVATVFPQAIGMAATWNPALIQREADVISTEARAKHQEHVRKGEFAIYQGLTFWSPNINIFRDPRWGRGQETYGEDPFLTSRIGISFVNGLQGNDPKYFKVIATAKHFAVHSGPEQLRHSFDAVPSKQDLFETYLPAFEALVKEGKVYSIMGAYNALYGKPACASDLLMKDLLRNKWGFQGYVVSDCGAIYDFYNGHKMYPGAKEASAAAVLAGTDLTCGTEYVALEQAVAEGLISVSDIDVSIKRLFLARFKLGMFDPASMVSYANIPFSENNTPEHDRLSLDVAHQSMVLLKNNGILPLGNKFKKILVVGPNSDNLDVLLGNYNGNPSNPVNVIQGIRNKADKNTEIIFEKGMASYARNLTIDPNAEAKKKAALEAAAKSDVVIFVGGISPRLEGEEMKVNMEGFSGGDRTNLDLPKEQEELLKALKATGKPIVLVLMSGSALSVNWEDENLPAILQAWYPGQEGGNAVADVLFGNYNPGGRLPITFYKSVNDLPKFEDYSMKGRTYKYFEGKALYPFGYGLSYSTFKYNTAKVTVPVISAGQQTFVEVNVTNTSKIAGDEVVQVYVSSKTVKGFRPLKSLAGFERVNIPAGKTVTVKIPVNPTALRQFDEAKNDYTTLAGAYQLLIGSSSSDIKLTKGLTIR
jgi:beta-glucosidase